MTSHQQGPLVDAIGRIWAQLAANSRDVGDLFERIIQSYYSKVVRPGDVVVDGGAHTGRHTIPLARLVGPAGLVVAFEPLRSASEKLQHLLLQPGLASRVRLHSQALGATIGTATFFVVHNMPEFSGLRSRDYVGFVPEQSEMQVEVETVDSAVGATLPAGSLSFIKLDLEGGEFRALQGSRQTLLAHGPSCVFENGLHSSAGGYDADEFFGYFRAIDYELYDIFGCRVLESQWRQNGPWNFIALPRARSHFLLPLIWTSALEELLATSWAPDGQRLQPPESLRLEAQSAAMSVIGHVDRVETTITVRGWAGDAFTGRPVRSIVIAVDGVPLAACCPGKPRYDVVAATEHVGFTNVGFDLAAPAASSQGIVVYAEAADGSFVKLG